MNRARTLLVAVVGHVVLSAVHGLVHLAIPVHVHGWQYGYAGVVILLAPIVGAALIVRGRTATGVWLLLLSGLAALAFEGIYHFVVVNPDHVSTVESGRALFEATAWLTTASDVVLVVASVWFLAQSARGRQIDSVAETTMD